MQDLLGQDVTVDEELRDKLFVPAETELPDETPARVAHQFLSPTPDMPATWDEIYQGTRAAVREGMVDQADQVLAGPQSIEEKAPAIIDIAGQAEVVDDVTVGVTVNGLLAAQEDPATAATLKLDLPNWRKERAAVHAVVREEWLAEVDRTLFPNGRSGPLEKAVAFAGQMVGGVADVLTMNTWFKNAQILADELPGNTLQLGDFTTPAAKLKAWKEWVSSGTPEDARTRVRSMMANARKRAGFAGESNYEYIEMLDFFLKDFDVDPDGWKNFASWGEALGFTLVAGVPNLLRPLTSMFKAKPAAAAARTPAGASVLIKAMHSANPAQSLKLYGTNPVEVMSNLVLPRVAKPTSKPFLPDAFVDPVEQAIAAEAKLAELSTFSTRMKDYTLRYLPEGGIRTDVVLGPKKGLFFKTEKAAAKYAASLTDMGTATVLKVQNGKGFLVHVDDTHYWDLSDKRLDNIMASGQRGTWGRAWDRVQQSFGGLVSFGKATRVTTDLQESGTAAATYFARETTAFKTTMQPFTRLSHGKQAGITKVYTEIEGTSAPAGMSDVAWLRSKGLDDDQIQGALAIREAGRQALAAKNVRARGLAQSDGWLGGKLSTGDEVLIRPSTKISGAAIDMKTGAAVNVSQVNRATHTIYETLGENGQRGLAVVETKVAAGSVVDLPDTLVKMVPWYLPRLSRAPFYIDEVLPGDSHKTLALADTEGEARAYAELLSETTGKSHIFRRANELTDQAGSIEDLSDMARQGLLYTSKRGPEVIKDWRGTDRLIPFDQRLNQMVHSGAMSKGLAAWSDAQDAVLKRNFGERWSLSYGAAPTETASGLSAGRFQEAKALWEHARMMNGMAPGALEGRLFRPLRNLLGDAFYGTSVLLRNTNLPGFETARSLANNISGLSESAATVAKSLSFAAHMATNPFRQLLIQATNIPTFMGVEGGVKYAMTQGFMRDWAVIQAAITPGPHGAIGATAGKLNQALAIEAAARLGMPKKDAIRLIEDFNKSYLWDLNGGNHAFTLGTLMDSKLARPNLIVAGAGHTVEFMKRIGIDLSIGAETRAAWLFSRNRFLTQNKRLPQNANEWAEVTASSSRLQGNMNRADVLPIQKGMLSLLTQFYTHQFKMAGRILGLEVGFTPAEKARMALVTAVSYGLQGYGFTTLVDKIEAATGSTLPEPVKYLILQGLIGNLLNTAFAAFDGPDDLKTQLDVSGSVAPMNFIGPTVKTAGQVLIAAMTDETLPDEVFREPAVLGLAGNVWGAFRMGGVLAGRTEVTTPEAALAVAAGFFKQFPIGRAIIREHYGRTLGLQYDSRGNKVLEISKGEARAALLGISSQRLQSYYEAKNNLKPYTPPEDGDLDTTAVDLARDTMEWMGPLLRSFDPENIHGNQRAQKLLQDHAVAMGELFKDDPQRRKLYWTALERQISNMDVLQTDRFVTSLGEDFKSGKGGLPFGAKAMDLIEAQPDFPGKDRLIDLMKTLLEAAEVGKEYTKD